MSQCQVITSCYKVSHVILSCYNVMSCHHVNHLVPEVGVGRGRGDHDDGVSMTHDVRIRGHEEADIVPVHHPKLVTRHQGHLIVRDGDRL